MRQVILLAAAVTLAASSAFADTPAPAQDLGGPLVPGVCVLSRQDVLTSSKVGQAATARLRELAAQAQADVDLERKPLETEAAALNKAKAALTPAQFEARNRPLEARWNAMRLKADQRSRELEATRQKALERIALEAQPLIADVYHARNCGLLFAREAMLGGNGGADITPAVVQALDAKITTISFDRENLASPVGAPAPVASR
jgi:Skp family chaperone for outer membrane proteins